MNHKRVRAIFFLAVLGVRPTPAAPDESAQAQSVCPDGFALRPAGLSPATDKNGNGVICSKAQPTGAGKTHVTYVDDKID